MTQVIHGLMGMALWGSIASIVVLMVRPIIKKESNRGMCFLWIVVMFRFLCPFAIESSVPAMPADNTQTVSSGDVFGKADAGTEKVQGQMDTNVISNLPDKAGSRFADGANELNELALGGDARRNEMRSGSEIAGIDGNKEVSQAAEPDMVRTESTTALPEAVQKKRGVANANITQMTGETLAYDDASAHDALFASDRANDGSGTQDSSSVMSILAKTMAFVKETLDSARAQFLVKCFGIVWILGSVLLMIRGISRYHGIARALNEAVFLRKWGKFSVKVSEVSGVPMAFGILHPVIYVPLCFEEDSENANEDSFSDCQKDMILWHESMHLKRHDPLWKLVAFVMVVIHWWNPLAWICVKCINQDIEMACDESVLARIGHQNKEEYVRTLFGFATRKSGISLTASFGESHAESRIKNALKYRRSPLWITIVTSVLIVALGGCLALKPVSEGEKRDQEAGEEQNVTDHDAAEIEKDQEAASSEALWVQGGENYVTTFPLGKEEATLKVYSVGTAAYFELESETQDGHGTLSKWYEKEEEGEEYVHYGEYPIQKIDEIGYADINFDQVNDLIIIGETQKGKCVYVVESKDGIWYKDEPRSTYLFAMDRLSNSVEELLGEHPTVKGVKDALFGKDYDGTFQNYQDAYELVARIQNMKADFSSYDLIYFNDDDIPDLVIDGGSLQLYLFEGGKVYCSDFSNKVSNTEGCYIERQSIAGNEKYVKSEGEEIDYFQIDPDHNLRKLCGYLVESGDSVEKESQLTYLDYSEGNLSQEELKKKIEGYQKEQKQLFPYRATYRELLYRLGKLSDVHETIASYVKIADTPQTIDHLEYAKAYMKIIDDMTLAYPGNKLKFDLIYFNDDRYPDLVVDYTGSWISLYVYEDGEAINVWDKKGYNTEECSKYTYINRCNLIITYARSKKTEGKAYVVKAGKKTDILSYIRSEKYYDENDEYTFGDDLHFSTQWYLNDKEITQNEVENMGRHAWIYCREVSLCGVESADAMKKRLASEMNHKELDIVVSQDSLYERFKNGNEKVYFNGYDGRTLYGPNFDLEKGYALSELIDTVWIHYKERHLEYSPECTTMLLDFAYLDCGQDGDPEMAIEFKNVGISSAEDASTLILVIKEINGKLQCTYGDETWCRSGGMINSAGIMFSMGNYGGGQDGYALGILDANAECHWVYGVDTNDFNTAYDYFTRVDGAIYRCRADVNDEEYVFYVSNDPKITGDALFNTMKKHGSSGIKNAKEVAKILKQAKESYGITEEMLWLDPLFESSYCEYVSGNPLEMVNYVSGKALGWD